jgi:gas vesicle protein
MMRDRLQDPNDYAATHYGSSGLSTFLLGAAAGAAVALLLAPAPGRESRAWLKSGARRLRDGAEDKLGEARHALDEGASAVRGVVESGKEAVAAGREAFTRTRDAVGSPSPGPSGSGAPAYGAPGTSATTTSRTP